MAVASHKAIKEGSIMEGLFAMHCAAILIDPNDGGTNSTVKNFIYSLAVTTELKNMATKDKDGSFKQSVNYKKRFPISLSAPKTSCFDVKTVTGQQAKTRTKNPKLRVAPSLPYFETIAQPDYPDFSSVNLKIRLKEKEVGTQYGSELQMLIDKQPGPRELKQEENFESIEKRMDAMIKARGATFFRKIVAKKKKWLMNNKTDVMEWQVDADGVAGETTKGTVKQDITIRVWANGKRIFDDTINFSLKASSATFHSGGLNDGMDLLLNKMDLGIPSTTKKDIQTMLKDLQEGRAQETGLTGYVDAAFRLILKNAKPTYSKASSDAWWDLMGARLYGERNSYHGYMELLELNPDSKPNAKGVVKSGILEITPEWLYKLRYEYNVGIQAILVATPNLDSGIAGSPGDIRLMPVYPSGGLETNINKNFFKLRINYKSDKDKLTGIRGTVKPFKFMSDIGGKTSIVWDMNSEKFKKQLNS